VNTQQAYQTLKVNSDATFEDVRGAYRKLALSLHPDKNKASKDDLQFKRVTEAYHFLKSEYRKGNIRKRSSSTWTFTSTKTNEQHTFRRRPQWSRPPGGNIPEEDWSKFTREFEEENPNWWREYEKSFWEEYDNTINKPPNHGEFDKVKEPKSQPNLFVYVDHSLCIGCCSCETIAPEVFLINKKSKMNPKSSVINPKGAGVNKIMNAAETCPTKAIVVENLGTKERLYPI